MVAIAVALVAVLGLLELSNLSFAWIAFGASVISVLFGAATWRVIRGDAYQFDREKQLRRH